MHHAREPFPVRAEEAFAAGSHAKLPSGALAAAALALAVILSACGGGGSSKPVASPSSTTTSTAVGAGADAGSNRPNGAALQAFRSCMQTQGVTIPTAAPRPAGETTTSRPAGTGNGGRGGGFGGGGLGGVLASTDPKTQAAVKTCQGTLPAGFLQAQQARQNAQAAFISCMKDHGVTVSTAAPGAAGSGTTPSTIDRTTPAYKFCSPLLPTRPNNGAGAGATPTTGQ